MKIIRKKISLEQFKSRIPSIVPAYKNNELVQFSDNINYIINNINELDNNQLLNNYGMLPCDIIINNKTISFNTFAKWYHFLNEYNSLLSFSASNSNSLTESFYDDAKEYYKYNKSNTKYTYDECITLDKKMDEIKNSLNLRNLSPKELYENHFEKYVPYFNIPIQYQNAWKKNKLSLKEVLFWNKWFSSKQSAYESINDCKESNNCCECEKYKQLGGKTFNDLLTNYINKLLNDLGDISESFKENTYISLPIVIQNSIKNLGDFTEFGEDFEPGEEYEMDSLVQYNDKIWRKKTSGVSSLFSETFKEHYFNNEFGKTGLTNDDREKYEDKLDNVNTIDPESFSNAWVEHKIPLSSMTNGYYTSNWRLSYSSYTFNEFGKAIYNPKIIDTAKKYKIINNKCCLINNKIYEVETSDIITLNGKVTINGKTYDVVYGKVTINSKTYDVVDGKVTINGKTYDVVYGSIFKVQYTDNSVKLNPFINLNNNIYFANYNDVSKNFYFDINCDNPNYITNEDVIYYNNKYYKVTNGSVIINQNEYKIADYYFTTDTESYLIGKDEENDKILCDYNLNAIFGFQKLNHILNDDAIDNLSGYIIDDNFVYLFSNVHVYQTNKVTGYTESKVKSFEQISDLIHDNLGNKLNCIYNINHYDVNSYSTTRISPESWLDIPYLPNTVCDLTKINNNKYWGNLLTELRFYYVDNNGNDLGNYGLSVTYTYDDFSSGITQCDVISDLKEIYNSFNTTNDFVSKHFSINPNIKCDITYYIGCEMVISAQTKYVISGNNGIKYIDTVTLIPSQANYYIDKHNSFPINYYEMVWDKIEYKSNKKDLKINKAYFEYNIKPNFNDNGFINSPIVKEEYKLWTSSLENVKSDIYIQRGLSRSIDNHLKLLEVKSFESLENYGNSHFKII